MMRTTLTLDDDVATRLQAESRRSGQSFKVVVNEHLRAALAQRKTIKTASSFHVEPVDMGAPQAGRSYDDVAGLLEEIEVSAHR
jgi:hypothetical protein